MRVTVCSTADLPSPVSCLLIRRHPKKQNKKRIVSALLVRWLWHALRQAVLYRPFHRVPLILCIRQLLSLTYLLFLQHVPLLASDDYRLIFPSSPAGHPTMFRRFSTLLVYQPVDVRSKTIFERALAAKVKAGVREDEVDHDALAIECGLLPSTVTDTATLAARKQLLIAQLQEQKRKRISQREAFLEWQAGQREKGAAHRLLRQTKTAEKYKRRHYHSRQGHVISVSHASNEDQMANSDRWLHQDEKLTESCMSTTEYLHSAAPSEHRVYLSLQRKW